MRKQPMHTLPNRHRHQRCHWRHLANINYSVGSGFRIHIDDGAEADDNEVEADNDAEDDDAAKVDDGGALLSSLRGDRLRRRVRRLRRDSRRFLLHESSDVDVGQETVPQFLPILRTVT